MAHTYSSVTKSDNTFTAVSPVRDWVYEETLTWDILDDDYDTWIEFYNYGRIRWCDWWNKVGLDIYTAITTPDYTYQEVTK